MLTCKAAGTTQNTAPPPSVEASNAITGFVLAASARMHRVSNPELSAKNASNHWTARRTC